MIKESERFSEGQDGREVLPGACVCEIGEINMVDIIGPYDSPDEVPEWSWVEKHACFAHCRNGEDGIWEFFLSLSSDLRDAPERLQPVIAEARRKGLVYLLVHQGT